VLDQFIKDHLETADLHRLLLSAGKYPGVDVPRAVAQIAALRKIKTKVPSWYDPAVRFPPTLSLEQSSSEATARLKAGLFSGVRLVDLTGGMGIDSFFWANSFQHVDYVEQSGELCALAQHNFATLGKKNIAVHHNSAEAYWSGIEQAYDLCYLDPARRDDQKKRVFLLTDCTPNIVELQRALLQKSKRVLVKTAPMLDLHLAMTQLEHLAAIWVVAHRNECKEVLYLLDPANALPMEAVPICCIDLGIERTTEFVLTKGEEAQSVAEYSAPSNYLYEPNAAVLKAGAFQTFAQRFGLKKLDKHTHLYTSDELIPDVPGRTFKIVDRVKYDAKAVAGALPNKKASVAVRNFPDSAEQVRKHLKLGESEAYYVFATTAVGVGKIVLVCERP
jgi:hypothetical protein